MQCFTMPLNVHFGPPTIDRVKFHFNESSNVTFVELTLALPKLLSNTSVPRDVAGKPLKVISTRVEWDYSLKFENPYFGTVVPTIEGGQDSAHVATFGLKYYQIENLDDAGDREEIAVDIYSSVVYFRAQSIFSDTSSSQVSSLTEKWLVKGIAAGDFLQIDDTSIPTQISPLTDPASIACQPCPQGASCQTDATRRDLFKIRLRHSDMEREFVREVPH